MGEKQVFQPLTKEDKVTVVLYRIGIVLSTLIIALMALLVMIATPASGMVDALVYSLYVSVGMSVFFIHLYVGKIKVFLKNLYYLSLACLAVLIFIGKGSLVGAFGAVPHSPLLLLPLSGCLGFVTAKEAFCFQLYEGYILAMLMPLYLILVSTGMFAGMAASIGLVLIAAMLIFFALRKVPMPIAYDIGDKSAYQ